MKAFLSFHPSPGAQQIEAAVVQQRFPPLNVFRFPYFNDYTFTAPEHQVTHPTALSAQTILRLSQERRGTVQYAPSAQATNPRRMLFGKQVRI